MRRNRPASITVIAILHFVFGGLGIVGGLCSGVQLAVGNQMFAAMAGAQAAQQKKMQEDLDRDLWEKLPSYKPVAYVGVGLELLMSGLMIAAGVGLLRLQPWGRTLSVCYALLSIAWKLFTSVYAFAVCNPVLRDILATMPREQGEAGRALEFKLGTEIGMLTAGILPLVFMIYPIVVLVIMAQPSVKAAVRGQRREPADEEPDYRDEPEDYRDEPEDR